MAIIGVGGISEFDVRENRDKLVDGLNAVKLGIKDVNNIFFLK